MTTGIGPEPSSMPPGQSGSAAPARAFMLEPFTDYLALERSAAAPTRGAYGRDVARFVDYVASHGAPAPSDVQARLVRAYVYHLKDLGLAAASIRRNVSAVRTYYRFLLADGHLARD